MDRCIFCSKELGMLKKKLACGNTTQILCGDCYRKYEPFSAVERAEAAFKTGRAEDAAELQEYLERVRMARSKSEEARKLEDEKRVTDKKCLRCKGRMLDYGPVTFKLGEETYFLSDINRLMSGSLTMNILRCEDCGKVEFYVFDSAELGEVLKKK